MVTRVYGRLDSGSKFAAGFTPLTSAISWRYASELNVFAFHRFMLLRRQFAEKRLTALKTEERQRKMVEAAQKDPADSPTSMSAISSACRRSSPDGIRARSSRGGNFPARTAG